MRAKSEFGIWSVSDVDPTKQYRLFLCQNAAGKRFYRLNPSSAGNEGSRSLDVVLVTGVVPIQLLEKRDVMSIAEQVRLESGERFYVDAHGIWFTDAEWRMYGKGPVPWVTGSPPDLPNR